jgi:hypothetical protein
MLSLTVTCDARLRARSGRVAWRLHRRTVLPARVSDPAVIVYLEADSASIRTTWIESASSSIGLEPEMIPSIVRH